MLRRVQPRLPDELESVVSHTIGSLIEVHRALGPGLLEGIYSRAVAIELATNRISFEIERVVPLSYRGQFLCNTRLDFVVEGFLVLELKSVERLAVVHEAQLLTYLKVAHMPVGLLVNFNVAVLSQGIKRIVL